MKRVCYVFSIFLLCAAISHTVLQIANLQESWTDRNQVERVEEKRIPEKRGTIKIKTEKSAKQNGDGLFYTICDVNWNPLYTKSVNEKGNVVFKDIPEGKYHIQREMGGKVSRLSCSAYVQEAFTVTVLD